MVQIFYADAIVSVFYSAKDLQFKFWRNKNLLHPLNIHGGLYCFLFKFFRYIFYYIYFKVIIQQQEYFEGLYGKVV